VEKGLNKNCLLCKEMFNIAFDIPHLQHKFMKAFGACSDYTSLLKKCLKREVINSIFLLYSSMLIIRFLNYPNLLHVPHTNFVAFPSGTNLGFRGRYLFVNVLGKKSS